MSQLAAVRPSVRVPKATMSQLAAVRPSVPLSGQLSGLPSAPLSGPLSVQQSGLPSAAVQRSAPRSAAVRLLAE
jgi:hypothetical protein